MYVFHFTSFVEVWVSQMTRCSSARRLVVFVPHGIRRSTIKLVVQQPILVLLSLRLRTLLRRRTSKTKRTLRTRKSTIRKKFKTSKESESSAAAVVTINTVLLDSSRVTLPLLVPTSLPRLTSSLFATTAHPQSSFVQTPSLNPASSMLTPLLSARLLKKIQANWRRTRRNTSSVLTKAFRNRLPLANC